MINETNEIYVANDVLIKLYLRCTIKHIYSSDAYLTSDAQVNNIIGQDNEDDCLNIHLTKFSSSLDLCGRARYPQALPKRYSCAVYFYCGAINLIHEIGHNLSLPHTFNNNACRNNCFQECVSRTRTQESYCFFTAGKKKCEVNGDCFCDTHADIKNKTSDVANYNCSQINSLPAVTYTTNANNCVKVDNYSDNFFSLGNRNAILNIMSYWSDCRSKFTKMQRGAMYYYSKHYGIAATYNNSASFYSNIDVDNYENDNTFHSTTNGVSDVNDNWMTINTRQYHTFHHNFNPTTACDVDWVYFINQFGAQNQYVIQTSAVAGKPNPDTKITLYVFNSDGTLGAQIATNDDITSGTNLFSKITPTLNSFNYALKIENKVTNVSDNRSKGHYYLRIDKCYDKTSVAIVGDAIICTNKPYSITSGLPTGASVTWTAAPTGYVSISTTNNVATVTKIASGTITLTATISYCDETYAVTKENIKVGLPYLLYSSAGCTYTEAVVETGVDEGPCNSQCYSPSQSKTWCATPVYNATSVTWQKVLSLPANYNFWSGSWSGNNNSVTILFKSPNQYVELKTTMTNTCGSIEQYYCFNSTTTLCPSQMMMMAGGTQTLKIYPNPTSAGNTITLELFLEEAQIDFENSTIQLIDSKNKVVFEKAGKKEMKEQLNIPSISSGTYYVSVTNINGTVSEELIINSGQ